jgi:uncharacterized protein (DUF924 family)
MSNAIAHRQSARDLVAFWRKAGPGRWFSKSPAFDAEFRRRFLSMHEAATEGQLDDWVDDAQACLALVILLDQFPRNAFRGTPRMYATDDKAREVAGLALDRGFDEEVDASMRLFLYLPFAHSERLIDQQRSVELNRRLGPWFLSHAEGHRDIIQRFDRFPHRNEILGRASTQAERDFLVVGGFAG